MVAPPPSKLDQRQILQAVLDEETGRLRTDAAATIVNADIDVALDSTEDSVAIKSSTGVELDLESLNRALEEKALRVDTSTTGIIYIGEAEISSLDNNPVWLIKKIDTSTSVVTIKYASSSYNQIWNNRASLSYV